MLVFQNWKNFQTVLDPPEADLGLLQQPLTIFTRSSILDVAAVLDPPLDPYFIHRVNQTIFVNTAMYRPKSNVTKKAPCVPYPINDLGQFCQNIKI